MKRLNNKGFAISTLLYGSILIIFLIVVALMATLGTTRKNTKNLMYQIDDELNRYSNINQHFVYDQDIDDEAGRKIFILEDGWYLIELWDTTNKFSGVAYFKKDEKINVYLKAKDADEVSYITFGENPNSPSIKHFDAVKYKDDNKELSEFRITKTSDNNRDQNPLPPTTDTKLNNVRYVKDCVTNTSTNNNTAAWTEVQLFDDTHNNILGNSSNFTKSYINDKTQSGTEAAITDSIIHDYSREGYFAFNSEVNNAEKCIEFTLNKEYNLSEIAIWHFHHDFRSYKNNKIYVAGNSKSYRQVNTDNREITETLLGIRYADRYTIN